MKADGSLHGVMTWFAVHTTSMNMTNQLVSSDNLGYAAYRMEKTLNPGRPAGKVGMIKYQELYKFSVPYDSATKLAELLVVIETSFYGV